MENLKSVIEALNSLGIKPIYILITISIYFIFSAIKTYFTGSVHLNTPIEVRRKNRLLFIKEELNNVNDQETRNLLSEEYKSMIFQEISGITTTPSRRSELIRLYHHPSINLSWQDIKHTIPHLRFTRSGKIKKGIHWIDKVFMSYFFFMSIAILLLSLYLTYQFNQFTIPKDILHIIATLLIFLIFFMLAYYAAGPAWPVLRAIQLQRWLPLENTFPSAETSDFTENSNENDETSSSSPPDQSHS